MMLGSHLRFSTLSRCCILRRVFRITPVLHDINTNLCLSSRSLIGKAIWPIADIVKDHDSFMAVNKKRSLLSPSLLSHVQHTRRWSIQQPNFSEKPVNSEEYKELYFIDNIRFFRLLCRFAKYSFLMFIIGSPACIISSFFNIFSIETLRVVFLCLTFYMTIFTSQSFLFTSRLVAKIMINPDNELLKISRLTLFGNRKDLYIKPSDIIKFPYFGPQLMSKTMLILKFQNRSERLIFLPRNGGIDTNHEALELLLCSDLKEKPGLD